MVVNINQSILSLTQDTVDDSATIRVVTIVTLIYVPASFVSVYDPPHPAPATHRCQMNS
jgi:hypothetical protein